jgi:hypothetical protein
MFLTFPSKKVKENGSFISRLRVKWQRGEKEKGASLSLDYIIKSHFQIISFRNANLDSMV